MYLFSCRRVAQLCPDAVHFGLKNLIDVLAKGHNSTVGAAALLLLSEAAGSPPDQRAGLMQGLRVGPGSIQMHRFQRDQLDPRQVCNLGLEVMAGCKVNDGQRAARLLSPVCQCGRGDTCPVAAAPDEDVRLPDGGCQFRRRERRPSPGGYECLCAAGLGENRDV